jgi:predicted nucleic acid-binding protein
VTVHYVETSALLNIVLEGNVKLSSALSGAPSLITSSLTFLEFERALLRRRADGTLTAGDETKARKWAREFASLCYIMELDTDVMERAKLPFKVEPVRTLDALHLASIDVLAKKMGWLVVVACDHRVRQNAVALGFNVLPSSM